MRFRIAALMAIAAIAALLPVSPAAAASAYEIHYVPYTHDGQTDYIRVEIMRDTKYDAAKQPVIFTYSPYNNLNDAGSGQSAGGGGGYNSKGYAYAVADVLGTRGSTGCWDYGGRDEALSGAAVVNYLSGLIPDEAGQYLTWSNGNVGMTGVSYEGTTANMVAALGPDVVPGLKGIIPIAAISKWYGYAFNHGVRYFGNSMSATDEGFDTPLAFDFGFGRTLPIYDIPDNPKFVDLLQARVGECGAAEHTMQGYSRTPDYGQFWLDRDYVKDADKVRAAVMVVHGWQDFNVKQEEGLDFYEALPVDDPSTHDVVEGVPFKKLWMTQSTHAGGSGPGYSQMVDAFWARTLKGNNNGVEGTAQVTSRMRTDSGAADWSQHDSWPPEGTSSLELYLGRSFECIGGGLPCIGPAGSTGESGTLETVPQNDGGGWTHVDNGLMTEEISLEDPANEERHGYYSLYQKSAPLAQDVRIAGSAVLDAYVNTSTPGQYLTPLLVDVAPSGTLLLVERGFLNTSYRNGLTVAEPATGWMHASVEFLPQDYTFKSGHRIGLILQASNTVWAVPGAVGAISYAMGPQADVTTVGTSLLLPVVDNPQDPNVLFVVP